MRRPTLAVPAVLAALLALAACARPESPPAPSSAPPSFREAGTLIGSTTRGGPSDLAGDWVVAQAFPGEPLAAPGARIAIPPGTRVGIGPGAGGATLWRFGEAPAIATTLAGPGRYRGEGVEIWVLWVDDDFRTMAVGTPDGRFGWIMDRAGAASPDRAAAAREMLDFNGYDLARLPPA